LYNISPTSDAKYQGRNQRKISGGRSLFDNDYDVIDVQSNMTRLFCYDQLTNSGGGTFFIVGAMGVHRGSKWAFAAPLGIGIRTKFF